MFSLIKEGQNCFWNWWQSETYLMLGEVLAEAWDKAKERVI